MATTAPMPLPDTEVVLDLDPHETCPVCTASMTGVQLLLDYVAHPAAASSSAVLMTRGSLVTALPCRCVISDRTPPKEAPMPHYVDALSLQRPPEDAPRAWHTWYARAAGYFWLPCPLCGTEFGGHEWLSDDPVHASTIPQPEDDPFTGTAICPACTRAGRGTDAWAAAGLRYNLANLPDELRADRTSTDD